MLGLATEMWLEYLVHADRHFVCFFVPYKMEEISCDELDTYSLRHA